jgi:hypothetical protein
MRLVPLLALALALVACDKLGGDKPEITACDSFVKASLKAPSTYKRISAVVLDEPISKESYASGAGSKPRDPLYDFHKQQAINPAIRNVVVEYDADNSFGVPLRSKMLCEFLMSDSIENLFNGDPKSDSENVTNRNRAKSLVAALNSETADEKPCCLRAEYLDAREKAR